MIENIDSTVFGSMKDTEKGAVAGLTVAIVLLIILGIIGIGWHFQHESDTTNGNGGQLTAGAGNALSTGGNGTGYTYNIASSTTTATNGGNATAGTQTVTKTATYKVPVTTKRYVYASAYSGGPVYHNSTYGLTIGFPSTWTGYRTYTTSGGVAGFPDTLSIHFVAPGSGADTFVVNVWSKQQWNDIRNQENFAHQNVNDLGEGNYLGENFVWIYSVNNLSGSAEVQGILNGATFY